MYECCRINGWMVELMDRVMDGCIDLLDLWIYGWMDEWM